MGFADQDGDNPDANPHQAAAASFADRRENRLHLIAMASMAASTQAVQSITAIAQSSQVASTASSQSVFAMAMATTVIDYGFYTRTILAQDNS